MTVKAMLNVQSHKAGLHTTRASLLSRIKDLEDDKSWMEFFDRYWKLIYNVSRHIGLTDPEAQDVVQETMVHVSKKIGNFKYDPEKGSFKAWLLRKVRWASKERFRSRARNRVEFVVSEQEGTSPIEKIPDPASLLPDKVWEEQWQIQLLEAAELNVKQRVNPRTYQLYDFYQNKQWPAEKVAKQFGVSVELVHTAKHRIIQELKKETKRLERHDLG